MTEHKVEHDRPGCIGCGACAAVAPELWEMSGVDGKSDLITCERKEENGEVVLEFSGISQDDFGKQKEAAESCPVNVIHIVNKDTGEKLI